MNVKFIPMSGLILFVRYTVRYVNPVSLQNTVYRETRPLSPPLFLSVYIPPRLQRLTKHELKWMCKRTIVIKFLGTTPTHTWGDMAKPK